MFFIWSCFYCFLCVDNLSYQVYEKTIIKQKGYVLNWIKEWSGKYFKRIYSIHLLDSRLSQQLVSRARVMKSNLSSRIANDHLMLLLEFWVFDMFWLTHDDFVTSSILFLNLQKLLPFEVLYYSPQKLAI